MRPTSSAALRRAHDRGCYARWARYEGFDKIFPGARKAYTGRAYYTWSAGDPHVGGAYPYLKTGQYTRFNGFQGQRHGNSERYDYRSCAAGNGQLRPRPPPAAGVARGAVIWGRWKS